MYFWDSRRLAVDLRNDAVPAATMRNYFIALLIVAAPSVWSGVTEGKPTEVWDWIYVLGAIAIIIIGIRRAYQTNGGDQGSRFIEKSVALLLPITVQSYLLGALTVMLLFGLESALIPASSPVIVGIVDNLLPTLAFLALEAWVMWRLTSHISDTLTEGPDRIGSRIEDAPPPEAS